MNHLAIITIRLHGPKLKPKRQTTLLKFKGIGSNGPKPSPTSTCIVMKAISKAEKQRMHEREMVVRFLLRVGRKWWRNYDSLTVAQPKASCGRERERAVKIWC